MNDQEINRIRQQDAMRLPDPHDWNAKVGNRVVKSATSVWETLTSQWCKSCLESTDREMIIDKISALLRNGV